MFNRRVYLTSLVWGIGLVLTGIAQAEDPSLMGWWKFDEGAGTIAKDSSVNGNDATLSGGTAWVPGVGGTALQFNGSDSLVSTGKSLLNNLTEITLAGWISASNPNAYVGLFGQNDCVEFCFTTESGGQIGTWMAGNGWQFVGVNYTFSYPSWHHLALTGNATGVRIYIDGQEEARGTTGMTNSGSSSSPFNIGGNVNTVPGPVLLGEIDDVRVYNRALNAQEIQGIMRVIPVELAVDPSPEDKATDVPRDAVLTWTPGLFAKTHDVYFGTAFEDVNNATSGLAQDVNSYDPAGLLEFGRTYYWRIDEINAPPDSTLFKGTVWNFTTEPMGYPIKSVKATASSFSNKSTIPDNTINGSGIDTLDQHSINAPQMWLSKKNMSPIWIQYEFDNVYRLHEMWVWNQNQLEELDDGLGAKEVSIDISTDGNTWTALEGVPEFAQGPGDANYVHNTTVHFRGALAKYVRLNIKNNWAGSTTQAGLSEVRFFYVPVKAFGPTPAVGDTGVALDAVLNWRPGREAVRHEVYLGTDPNAVANGTAQVQTVTEHRVALGSLGLEYGKTYYWKVNEVNDAATPKSWEGAVWSFTTVAYAVVDGFESYDDLCKRIFYTWADGYGASAPECGGLPVTGNGTGSTVGNAQAPYAEQTIVNTGRQSLPMAFDNTRAPYYSEAQREWTPPQAWTGGGANTLRMYLRGDAAAFIETSPGNIIMNGMGTDIWGTSDQCRFVYKALSGNGTLIARIDGVANTNAWAKAGVMIRETLDADSAMAIAGLSADNRVVFQWRTAAGVDMGNPDSTTHTVANGVTLPRWVKLTRNGNVFTVQHSADGMAWQAIVPETAGDPQSMTIPMNTDVYVGLAVSSHAPDVVCGAKFSSVSTAGSVSGTWQSADIGIAQVNGNVPETFYLAVQDNAGKLKVVSHPDPSVIATGIWEEWNIPLNQFTSAGINLNNVKKMILGVGDQSTPKAGNAGKVYIDDIRLTRVATP